MLNMLSALPGALYFCPRLHGATSTLRIAFDGHNEDSLHKDVLFPAVEDLQKCKVVCALCSCLLCGSFMGGAERTSQPAYYGVQL